MKALQATTHHVCSCGTNLERIDAQGDSATMRCKHCRRCSLIVEHPNIQLKIGLSDFHIKRGDKEGQRPLEDLGMAERLVQSLKNDEWPSPATVADFGIDSSEHYLALKHAVYAGMGPYELDRVMGDGPAITKLVHGVPHQLCRFVRFRTAWDDYESTTDRADLAIDEVACRFRRRWLDFSCRRRFYWATSLHGHLVPGSQTERSESQTVRTHRIAPAWPFDPALFSYSGVRHCLIHRPRSH